MDQPIECLVHLSLTPLFKLTVVVDEKLDHNGDVSVVLRCPRSKNDVDIALRTSQASGAQLFFSMDVAEAHCI